MCVCVLPARRAMGWCLRCIWLSITSDIGMGAAAKLTHIVELAVHHDACVPDMAGSIPISVGKKGLGTTIKCGLYICLGYCW